MATAQRVIGPLLSRCWNKTVDNEGSQTCDLVERFCPIVLQCSNHHIVACERASRPHPSSQLPCPQRGAGRPLVKAA